MKKIQEENLTKYENKPLKEQKIDILKSHFNECFDNNGNFIVEKLQEMLNSNGIEASKESYSLNWLGKSYARLLANEKPLTMLKEDLQHNNLEQNINSKNLLIKGDNLEVLKHLINAYYNKIKVIYIDPPYNTGNDGFVYNDNRKFTPEQLSQLAGIELEKASKILDFTASKSNSHSSWLTFMYPRLYIARKLLKQDGAIFISIDDNEQAQLKMLCDEIFGEENFITDIVWKKKGNPSNTQNVMGVITEHILCYAKSKQHTNLNLESFVRKYKYQDELGEYNLEKPLKTNEGDYERRTMAFPVVDPVTKKDFLPPVGKRWTIGKETFDELLKEGKVIFDGDDVKIKKYEDDYVKGSNKIYSNLFLNEGSLKEAKNELEKMGFPRESFDTPKPIRLMSKIIQMSTQPNNDDIILDFFAGSGTTAHAVINENFAEKGNRQFILVQLPEEVLETRKKTYYFIKNELNQNSPTIFDITKERVTRAINEIKEQDNQYNGDLGFKIFETTLPLENSLETMNELKKEGVSLFDVSTLKEEDYKAILTTWQAYDGIPLHENLREIQLKNYIAYYGDKKLYLIDGGFTTEDLKEFIIKLDKESDFEPNQVIIFGYIFDSKHQREIHEALSAYANKKSIEIDVIVRY